MEVLGLIKTIDLEKQEFKSFVTDDNKRYISGFFSTPDPDKIGDIVLPVAFENAFVEYMKHPVVTYMHDLHTVIGKTVDYKILPNGVWVKIEIVKGVKKVEDEIWPLIEQGIIKGFSFGFAIRDAVREGDYRVIKNLDLYEISVVSVPMNYNATFIVDMHGKASFVKVETTDRKEGKMANIIVNDIGVKNAKKLIRSGKINMDDAWSFSADDGNAILGDDNWDEYRKWFLAEDTSANEETKERYKFPYGKNGMVYRSGIIAIKQRAGQYKYSNILEVADELLQMIDEQKEKSIIDLLENINNEIQQLKSIIQEMRESIDKKQHNKEGEDIDSIVESIKQITKQIHSIIN